MSKMFLTQPRRAHSRWQTAISGQPVCVGTSPCDSGADFEAKALEKVSRDARLSVRLAPEDRILLSGRATARGMPSATYVSVLVRSHLRNLVPLPKEELSALKRSVAELGAIGRNLNQIARAANHAGNPRGPGREDLRSMLKVAEACRFHACRPVIPAGAGPAFQDMPGRV
jgi:hypothetical protein